MSHQPHQPAGAISASPAFMKATANPNTISNIQALLSMECFYHCNP